MKQLGKDNIGGVVRDLDNAPYLVRWLIESRAELIDLLIGCSEDDFQHVQGQIITINQILDKCTDLE